MTKAQVMGTVKMLASSQGMYGRLYEWLQDVEPEIYDQFMEEACKCKDAIDFIMWFES